MIHRAVIRPLFAFVLALTCLFASLPAYAAVTITFWSHELDNSFPHAFFTLRGTPDAGGPPVDANYGFTARTISPAILMGTVGGKLDIAKPAYTRTSDAQFSVVMTDAQYADVMKLVAEWGGEEGASGDSHYNLNNRNCVHFVAEAARRVGLTGLDQPKLMKKPRSFLQAVAAANAGHVTPVDQSGAIYLASLPPLPGAQPGTTAAPLGPVAVANPAPQPVHIVPALAKTN